MRVRVSFDEGNMETSRSFQGKVAGLVHSREASKSAEEKERARRLLQTNYATKAIVAIIVIVLVVVAFDFVYPSLGIKNAWSLSTTFLFEAVIAFILGILTLVPGTRTSGLSFDVKKWFVIVGVVVAAVLFIFSMLTAYL